ncbi:hypothetical protein D9757_001264 [Collybiopsis confluens]|uniref:BTB domain-containing protein n=1 Tax=Collybiopsis confluens TaxID=2823264 RepID=A0A8H5MGI1_9AGAR|nr:hypothetical protein D9757_001264 [Collybiopsis confluens]
MQGQSERFNSSDADVIFRSSDNVLFRLHKQNLECTTGGFPPANTPSHPDDIVSLSESAKVLETLFTAAYPLPFPSMRDLDFDSLLELADAAEKYQVFSIIQACRREFYDLTLDKGLHTNTADLKSKRIKLLQLAIKHSDTEFMDILPRLLLRARPLEVVNIMPEQMYKQWTLERENEMVAQNRLAMMNFYAK